MVFGEVFPQEIKLNDLENIFKQLYMQYPKRNLNLPHSLDQLRDILELAKGKTKDPFPDALLENRLDEDLFFSSGFDTVLYRHLRYLPANWHSHFFFEIACVVEGDCVNYIQKQELPMRKGDICIIAPDTMHTISSFTDDCIIINIILRTSTFEKAFFSVLSDNDILSDFFMRTLYHSKIHPYLFFRTGGDQAVFDFILYAYQEFQGKHQFKELFLNNIVSAFFIILLRNHGSNVIIPEVSTQKSNTDIVLVLKYLQENYNTVTLKQMAELFNYSDRQLQRIIKYSTGISFSENIQKLKMQQATRLLKNPDMSIVAVAEELGYMDPGNFRHIFKKYYGMTPAEFRNKE